MRALTLLLSLLAIILCSFSPGGEGYGAMNATSVMSYNIHIEDCGHLHPSWMERRSMVAQVIRLKSPEVLGLQGTSLSQLTFLHDNLKFYEFYYSKAINQTGLDLCPIMHDRRIYTSLEQGTYTLHNALSDEALSMDSHAGAPFLNWVKLEHIPSKRILYAINTSLGTVSHIDSKKDVTADLRNFIDDLVKGSTFVLMGDMATEPEEPSMVAMSSWAKDSHGSSLISISEIDDTFLGWEKCQSGKRLDYVFLSKDIPANSHEVVDIAFQNKFPSDHLPVFCRLRLN